MKRYTSIYILLCFIATSVMGPCPVYAQDLYLPAPGVRVSLSPEYNPPVLKGIKIHPDNPFQFDFILDEGDSSKQEQLKPEATRLIKYFLTSLTIPEKDLWVNLSPYEKNRVVPEAFGQTEMGRDLLAEDYMLKQITASLIYPEGDIGKKFWKRIYEEAYKKFGTTNIPVNTFNKVWIVPEKAVVYENAKARTAYVVESKLKVMLEQDYLSLEKHSVALPLASRNDISSIGANIIREIVIPELTREVNEDKNFSQLRQVYNSLILATWYKRKIKDSILTQVYADRNKIAGVNIDDPQEKEKIYQRYIQAFKKGVYNYVKEDLDPVTQEMVPRKYFSGGFNLAMTVHLKTITEIDPAQLASQNNLVVISTKFDAAMKVPIANSEGQRYSDILPSLHGNLLKQLEQFLGEGINEQDPQYAQKVMAMSNKDLGIELIKFFSGHPIEDTFRPIAHSGEEYLSKFLDVLSNSDYFWHLLLFRKNRLLAFAIPEDIKKYDVVLLEILKRWGVADNGLRANAAMKMANDSAQLASAGQELQESLLVKAKREETASMTLSNIKKGQPPITLDISFDESFYDPTFLVNVSVQGVHTGSMRLIFKEGANGLKGLISTYNVFPIGGPSDDSHSRYKGKDITNTILNWLAWEANKNNCDLRNDGTDNIQLIYLFLKYFGGNKAHRVLNENIETELTWGELVQKHGFYDHQILGIVSDGETHAGVYLEKVEGKDNQYTVKDLYNYKANELQVGSIVEIGQYGEVWLDKDGRRTQTKFIINSSGHKVVLQGPPSFFEVPRDNAQLAGKQVVNLMDLFNEIREWGEYKEIGEIDGLQQSFNVLSDRKNLAAIIFDLIDNAVDKQQEQGKINIKVFKQGDKIGISIANKGEIDYDGLRERALKYAERGALRTLNGDVFVADEETVDDYPGLMTANKIAVEDVPHGEDLLWIYGLTTKDDKGVVNRGGHGKALYNIQDDLKEAGEDIVVKSANGETAFTIFISSADAVAKLKQEGTLSKRRVTKEFEDAKAAGNNWISRIVGPDGRIIIGNHRFYIGRNYQGTAFRLYKLKSDWEQGLRISLISNDREKRVGIFYPLLDDFRLNKIYRKADEAGRIIVQKLGYQRRLLPIGVEYAGQQIGVQPYQGDWEKGCIIYSGQKQIAVYIADKDIFSLLERKIRTENKGRFVYEKNRYSLGADYKETDIVLRPDDLDWGKGWSVYSGEEKIAVYIAAKNMFSLLEKGARTDDKGRFVYQQIRYSLGARYKGMDLILKPLEDLDWKSGIRVFEGGMQIMSYNFRSKDDAMAANGGIDLTPANMNLQTQNAGEWIKFHIDPAMLQQLQNAPGFVPVIINIQPMKDLRRFLGLQENSPSL